LPIDSVHTVGQLTDLIRHPAATAEPGAWIRTSNSSHESDLAESGLPTIDELDVAGRPGAVAVSPIRPTPAGRRAW
jgi:hypothetical protein